MNNSTLSYSRGRNFRTIAFRVILSIHGLFLLMLVWQPSFYLRSPQKKALVIKTIVPPSTKMVSVARPSTPKPEPVKSQAAPQAAITQKETPKPAQAKKKSPAPAPSASKEKKEPAIADKVVSKEKKKEASVPKPRAQISDSLFKELEESIAKIESKAKPSSSKTSLQVAPLALQIDIGDTTQDASFTGQLIACLQQSLTLPDYGEVKIQLDLREDGSVDKIVVLSAQSKVNKRYLEEHLPLLRFPRPDGVLHDKRARFVLTFANEV